MNESSAPHDRLGIRRPTSFTDERKAIAPTLNRFFLYGRELPDELFATTRTEGGEP